MASPVSGGERQGRRRDARTAVRTEDFDTYFERSQAARDARLIRKIDRLLLMYEIKSPTEVNRHVKRKPSNSRKLRKREPVPLPRD
jgi:hypothetical protein